MPQLIDRLAADGHRVVLTAAPDPDEIALIEAILGKAKSRPLNLAGKLSIKELGALTARATLFVGVDSMPMHLAAAMGTPTRGRSSGRAARPSGGRGTSRSRVVTQRAYLPSLRPRRLRRRQGERLPDAALRSKRCTRRRGAARAA